MSELRRSIFSWPGRILLACALAGFPLSAEGTPPDTPKARASKPEVPNLVEAYQKGPILLTARVIRGQGTPEEGALPLFQVPTLAFQDKLDLSFSGEAFDPRVTQADWSLIVVFLPKTIAPTDQGVVSFRLKRKGDQMTAPVIPVPYDSIPMIFLVPDRNGRKKVLKDLNDHLETFRTLCARICDLSEERSALDKVIADLEAIDKNLSGAQYDNAVLGFLHAYGNSVSGDLQAFLGSSRTNLEKFQFITQQFRKTNVLVPGTTASPVEAQVTAGTGGTRAVSAYISIIFDVAAIIQNLWPGHQFQYLPALARNFHDASAELYYGDWIHTTGDTRGALMCCPGKWEDQSPPAFDLAAEPGESLLRTQALLKVQPRENSRSPFSLFGHDWKLVATGPKGEPLPPVRLSPSPAKGAFVASPAPLQDPVRKLRLPTVKARAVGRWGFTTIATAPVDIPVGCDPAWAMAPEDRLNFQIGRACAIRLPAKWASVVEQVAFRPSAPGAAILAASLKNEPDGVRIALFQPEHGQAGPGELEITLIGQRKPDLSLPLTLLDAPPEPTGLEARLGEIQVMLRGRHLERVQTVEYDGRRFTKGATVPEGVAFRAEDGKAFEGNPGKAGPATIILATGSRLPMAAVPLLPARPRIGELQVIPMALKGSGFPLKAPIPIAPTAAPCQVNLVAPKGRHFPSDGSLGAALRNAAEPSEVRPLPTGRIRLMGNNQKATFTLTPRELMGDRASGKLEVRLQDGQGGIGDWVPLPATFLDLPNITAVQATSTGIRFVGPSLDAIEAVAPSAEGPWEPAAISIEEGHETLAWAVPLHGTVCYLKVFGWPDLPLALALPPSASGSSLVPGPGLVP